MPFLSQHVQAMKAIEIWTKDVAEARGKLFEQMQVRLSGLSACLVGHRLHCVLKDKHPAKN